MKKSNLILLLSLSFVFIIPLVSGIAHLKTKKSDNSDLDGVYLITNGGNVSNKTWLADSNSGFLIDLNYYVPTRDEGEEFLGWYSDAGLTNLVDNNIKIKVEKGKTKYYYARWSGEDISSKYSYKIVDKENKYIGISGFEGKSDSRDNLVFPRYYNDYKITTICDNAFSSNQSLDKVILSKYISSIGTGAFKSSSISTIEFNSEIKNINEEAFYNCNLLASIDLESCSSLQEIGNKAFYGTKINKITFPQSLLTIGDESFSNISTLTSVSFNGTNAYLKKIGSKAFYNSVNLTTINNFDSLYNLKTVRKDALNNTNYLNKFADGPFIKNNTFYFYKGQNSSESLDLSSSGVYALGGYAFEGLDNLTVIRLSDSCSYFGEYTFKGLEKLTTLNLPTNLNTICEGAFSGISKDLDFTETNVTRISEKAFKEYLGSKVTLSSDTSYFSSYSLSDTKCSIDFVNLESNVTFASYAFSSYLGSSVDFKNHIASISSYMFFKASNLESVKGLSYVTTYSSHAFDSCKNLSKIEISDLTTYLGPSAFKNCTKLKKLYVPSSVTYIGEGCFEGFTSGQTISFELSKKEVEGLLSGINWKKGCKAKIIYDVSNY